MEPRERGGNNSISNEIVIYIDCLNSMIYNMLYSCLKFLDVNSKL